jgi:hypothetical protein
MTTDEKAEYDELHGVVCRLSRIVAGLMVRTNILTKAMPRENAWGITGSIPDQINLDAPRRILI